MPVGSHQTASVLASPARPGQAQVFEIVSVFASPAAARAAYEQALGAATACRRFASGGTTFAVQDLASLSLPGADAAGHYRLVASTVIDGDVRTLARSGSKVVLLTGYGAPPDGLSPLAYQAQILARLLKHL